MSTARLLKLLVLLIGVVCVVIGVAHFGFGIASVPGERSAGATVDSRERFYAAVFIGYGLAWIWAARQHPIRAIHVRWLAGVFLLGGIGRIVSIAVHGWPQAFQTVLTVVEVVLPPVYLVLAGADERTAIRSVAYDPDERRSNGARTSRPQRC